MGKKVLRNARAARATLGRSSPWPPPYGCSSAFLHQVGPTIAERFFCGDDAPGWPTVLSPLGHPDWQDQQLPPSPPPPPPASLPHTACNATPAKKALASSACRTPDSRPAEVRSSRGDRPPAPRRGGPSEWWKARSTIGLIPFSAPAVTWPAGPPWKTPRFRRSSPCASDRHRGAGVRRISAGHQDRRDDQRVHGRLPPSGPMRTVFPPDETITSPPSARTARSAGLAPLSQGTTRTRNPAEPRRRRMCWRSS